MSGLARGTIHFRQGNSVTRFIYENFFVLIKKKGNLFLTVWSTDLMVAKPEVRKDCVSRLL